MRGLKGVKGVTREDGIRVWLRVRYQWFVDTRNFIKRDSASLKIPCFVSDHDWLIKLPDDSQWTVIRGSKIGAMTSSL